MATLSSCNEQHAVIRFLWAEGLNANEIYSVTSVTSTRLVYEVGWRQRKHVWQVMTWPACSMIATVGAFVRSDGTNVWTNLHSMLKNETLMLNIEVGNIKLLSLFVFFSLLSCLSVVSYDRKMVEKIIHRYTVFCD